MPALTPPRFSRRSWLQLAAAGGILGAAGALGFGAECLRAAPAPVSRKPAATGRGGGETAQLA